MQLFRFLPLAALCVGLVSCESTGVGGGNATRIAGVKTTAYTHTEADHKRYKQDSAVGTTLKYGSVRSAAADWSVYPVGTVFKIQGDNHMYEIDDYGSALVGTNTIDLYKPSKAEMNEWGARHVNIEVLKWGSFSKSIAIMKERQKAAPVKKMVQRIAENS